MEQDLALYGDKVVLLSKHLRNGSQSLSNIPYLVKQVIEQKMWERFQHPSASQLIDNSHLQFLDFVTTQPPNGLGTDLKTIENILLVQSRASDKKDAEAAHEALDLFVHEVKTAAGNVDLEELPPSDVDELKKTMRPTGRTREYALRRLQNMRPDLHGQVVNGELSPNKALIEAGLRERRITISQDNVGKAASSIRRKFSESQIEALIQELQQSQEVVPQ